MLEEFARMLTAEQRPEYDELLLEMLRLECAGLHTEATWAAAKAVLDRMNTLIQAQKTLAVKQPTPITTGLPEKNDGDRLE